MTHKALSIRLPSGAASYVEARSKANGRSMNSEVVRFVQIIMQAEPFAVRVRHEGNFFLIDAGDGTDLHSAHQSRAEALTAAQALIATMPPGVADLIDQTIPKQN